MHSYPSHGTNARNSSPSLPKFLRGLERTVHVSRQLVPRFNPTTGQMETVPAPKGSGKTLNLGKLRAERRREARADAHFRKSAGSAKAADRQFALHPKA